MNKKELKIIKEKALENHIPIIMDDTLEVIEKEMNIAKPKKILEIGTAVGYSAICFSKFLAQDGKIDTIERDLERAKEAKKNIKEMELDEKINIYVGDAVEILPNLNEKYDMIFIDAAKAQYIKFFTLYEPLLSDDGVIFTDNLLFHGLVNNSERIESKNLRNLVTKIENYNEWLANNEKYDTSFFSIGDGIAVSVKKNG